LETIKHATKPTLLRDRVSAPYQLFMLALCGLALIALGIASFVPLDPDTLIILDYADTVVCGLFFIDFLYSLARAERRLHYFLTWGWIDLLSSIPTVGGVPLGSCSESDACPARASRTEIVSDYRAVPDAEAS
jgi:hypothetical protein